MSQQPVTQQPEHLTQQATTVVMLDLLPGTRAYCDTFRDAPPILVIDNGPTEVQLSITRTRFTNEDLRLVDVLLDGLSCFRAELVARLP
jgi:hypothetical protein